MILNYFIKTELIATSFIDTDNKTHRVSFRYSYPSDCEKDATQKDAILEQVADVLADALELQQQTTPSRRPLLHEMGRERDGFTVGAAPPATAMGPAEEARPGLR